MFRCILEMVYSIYNLGAETRMPRTNGGLPQTKGLCDKLPSSTLGLLIAEFHVLGFPQVHACPFLVKLPCCCPSVINIEQVIHQYVVKE